MGGLGQLGKVLLVAGLSIAAVGGLMLLLGRFGVTRLPGDLVVERRNFTFYAPLGWMLVASLVLTLLLNLWLRR